MLGENVIEFTDANFATEVLQSDKLVLVDFTAVWCPPCKMLSPMIDKLAGEFAGKAKVGKLDADANHDTVIKYRVEALPTVIVFQNGQPIYQFRGLRSEKEYRAA